MEGLTAKPGFGTRFTRPGAADTARMSAHGRHVPGSFSNIQKVPVVVTRQGSVRAHSEFACSSSAFNSVAGLPLFGRCCTPRCPDAAPGFDACQQGGLQATTLHAVAAADMPLWSGRPMQRGKVGVVSEGTALRQKQLMVRCSAQIFKSWLTPWQCNGLLRYGLNISVSGKSLLGFW